MAAIANALEKKNYREALYSYVEWEKNLLQLILSNKEVSNNFNDFFESTTPLVLSQIIMHILVQLAFRAETALRPPSIHKEWGQMQDMRNFEGLLALIRQSNSVVLPPNLDHLLRSAIQIGTDVVLKEEIDPVRDNETLSKNCVSGYSFFNEFIARLQAMGMYDTRATWFLNVRLVSILFHRLTILAGRFTHNGNTTLMLENERLRSAYDKQEPTMIYNNSPLPTTILQFEKEMEIMTDVLNLYRQRDNNHTFKDFHQERKYLLESLPQNARDILKDLDIMVEVLNLYRQWTGNHARSFEEEKNTIRTRLNQVGQ